MPKQKQDNLVLGNYSKKEFNKLRKEWYAKLKDEGFEDIEKVYDDGNSSHFLVEHFRFQPERHPYIIDSVREYYSIAAEFYWSSAFKDLYWSSSVNLFDLKKAWKFHSEGCSIRQIAAAVGWSHGKTHGIIKEIEEKMWQWWKDSEEQRMEEQE